MMSAPSERLEQPFDEAVLAASQEAADCMQPMGWTSENVSRDFNVTRQQMDEFAAESFQRAERAQKEGWSQDEIVPIKTRVKGADGQWQEVTVTKDDGIRPGTTKEGLAKVRPAFPQWGDSTTGGNASQVTDGGKLFSLQVSQRGTSVLTINSCCRSPHEALYRYQARPAHPRQVRRLYRCRPGAPRNGHRPQLCHPQAPHQA